jgi:hypothetical protein
VGLGCKAIGVTVKSNRRIRYAWCAGLPPSIAPVGEEMSIAPAFAPRVMMLPPGRRLTTRCRLLPSASLIDEEFGAGILRDAAKNGYVTALSTKRS